MRVTTNSRMTANRGGAEDADAAEDERGQRQREIGPEHLAGGDAAQQEGEADQRER
jgi:hypothetical protein